MSAFFPNPAWTMNEKNRSRNKPRRKRQQEQKINRHRVLEERVDEHVEGGQLAGRDVVEVVQHARPEVLDEDEVRHEDEEGGGEEARADRRHGAREVQTEATLLHLGWRFVCALLK